MCVFQTNIVTQERRYDFVQQYLSGTTETLNGRNGEEFHGSSAPITAQQIRTLSENRMTQSGFERHSQWCDETGRHFSGIPSSVSHTSKVER